MYLGHHARQTPNRAALINAESNEVLTYAQLDGRSNAVANLLRRFGLAPGSQIAVLLPNMAEYFEVSWAALRSGLYLTPLNTYMTVDEIAYIVNDCGADVLIASAAFSGMFEQLSVATPDCAVKIIVGGTFAGWHDYHTLMARESRAPLAVESAGAIHCYSSGTTGRPKGVKLERPATPVSDGVQRDAKAYARAYHLTPATVYMTPAPLFHSAALHFSIAVQGQGGTVVMMEKFDARKSLQFMERFRVTHSQWVPTMFTRMLRIPKAEREAYDLSSHELALHGGAPCPVHLKRQMLDWWGPVLLEAYGCTELYGFTVIGAADWLLHPGSVGRSMMGAIHICDDSGAELPAGANGLVYFEGEQACAFQYNNDPERTRASRHPVHANWATVGDIGYTDAEGYLYLTDRKDFTIISGGVNISPQAVEDALAAHPQVDDVAVLGVPHAEMGEEVKALVQLTEGTPATEELARELVEYVRGKVARYMVPRSIEFVRVLPRLPNGKLYKQVLRDRFRADRNGATSGAWEAAHS